VLLELWEGEVTVGSRSAEGEGEDGDQVDNGTMYWEDGSVIQS
jgi:hypothetical protein